MLVFTVESLPDTGNRRSHYYIPRLNRICTRASYFSSFRSLFDRARSYYL